VVSKSGEQYFIAIEDTFDAIDVFMNCLLTIKTSENYMEPMTFVLPENRQVIEEALKSGYSVYENGKPDYLYYVLKGMPPF
jgi:L-rhamnose mutarotase